MTRLVVIDDQPDVRDVLVRLLARAGYDVMEAPGGREGLALIVKEKPDLVVCDISMPGMTGYEVLVALRRGYPHLAATPFVFLSAFADSSDIAAGLTFGADAYVTKPVEFDALVTTVETLADRMRHAIPEGPGWLTRANAVGGLVPQELRTPLNAILGYADLLRREAGGSLSAADQYRLAVEIRQAGEHLARLVEDMSIFAALGDGSEELRSEPVTLAPLIDEAIRRLAHDAVKPDVTVSVTGAEDCPLVQGDERLIGRTIDHLAHFAARFAEPGSSLTVSAAAAPGGGAAITLRTTTIGLNDQDVANLSDPKAAREDAKVRAYGIGIPLAHAAAERLKGRFSAQMTGPVLTLSLTLPGLKG